MRAYGRVTRNTGVSVGPVGIILLWPFYMLYFMGMLFVGLARMVRYAFSDWR